MFDENDNIYNYDEQNENNQPIVEKPKKNKVGKIILAVMLGMCILAVIGVGIWLVADTTKVVLKQAESEYNKYEENANRTDEDSVEVSEVTKIQSTETSGVVITDVSDVVNEVMPSIVSITSKTLVENNSYDDFWGYFYGYGSGNSETYEETSAGSGIIVEQTDSELLIVTNNHVVSGADTLYVTFIDDEMVEGYVKGTDSDADLAIISIPLENIKEATLEEIKKATLGDSDSIQVGAGVIAIGNALGYGQSVTTGVISAKDREIEVDGNTMIVLQTDAAINGGNSGGALLNSQGEVIGINVAKYSSSSYSSSASIEGMGFAIPISSAKDIINELMNRQTRMKVDEEDRGYLGITGYDVTSEESERYSMPVGVYVYQVIEGGAAQKAGLEANDIIVKLDGQTVSDMESLQKMLEYYKAGENVSVTIAYRDGRIYTEKDVMITLGSKETVSKEEETVDSGFSR